MSSISPIQSSHPDHTKKLIVYSQPLRLSRLCSFEEDFERNKGNMGWGFLKGRYPDEIVDREMSKVKFNFSRKVKLKGKKEKGVTLLVT